MPTIKASQNVDTKKLGPSIAPAATAKVPVLTSLPNQATAQQSPFMVSSMPSIASTADLFVRQFYNGSALPFSRILPVSR